MIINYVCCVMVPNGGCARGGGKEKSHALPYVRDGKRDGKLRLIRKQGMVTWRMGERFDSFLKPNDITTTYSIHEQC